MALAIKPFATLVLFALALAAAMPAAADPPARVGRLTLVSGAVSLLPAGVDDEWSVAYINRPVTTGDRLWAAERSRAEFRIGSAAVRLDSRTSVDVLALDDRLVQIRVGDGRLQLRIRAIPPDGEYEIDTPSGAVLIRTPGVYRIDVRPDVDETMLTVRDGEAEIFGSRASLRVRRGEQVTFVDGGASYDWYSVADRDEFDRFCDARDARDDRRAPRYVSIEMTGYEDLAYYGTWSAVATYGNVWFPSRVETGWVPYRDGRWVWVEPWGWTWVDNAPWGFAPFHYGRWVRVRERWGWVPGEVVARPVYAPALVAWVGGPNFRVSVSAGAPVVGWYPIGYREPYIPWYDASPTYIREVNVPARVTNINITNITNVTNIDVTNINYAYRRDLGAVTAVPASVVAQAQPVTRAVVRLQQHQLAQAPIVAGVALVTPSQQSVVVRAAAAKPPPQIVQRQVVAVQQPPPAPAPIAERLRVAQQHGAQPFKVQALPPRAAAATAAPSAPHAGPPARAAESAGKAPAAPPAAPPHAGAAAGAVATAPVQVIKPGSAVARNGAPASSRGQAAGAAPPKPPAETSGRAAAPSSSAERRAAGGAPAEASKRADEPAKAAAAPPKGAGPSASTEARKGDEAPAPRAAPAGPPRAAAPPAPAERSPREAGPGASRAPPAAPPQPTAPSAERPAPRAAPPERAPTPPSAERAGPSAPAPAPRAAPAPPAPPQPAGPVERPDARATPPERAPTPPSVERGGRPESAPAPRAAPPAPQPAPPSMDRAAPRQAVPERAAGAAQPPAPKAAAPVQPPAQRAAAPAPPPGQRAAAPAPAPAPRAQAQPPAAAPAPPAERAGAAPAAPPRGGRAAERDGEPETKGKGKGNNPDDKRREAPGG